MLRNRLHVLMAERRVTATQLKEATGLANSTIGYIRQNRDRNINYSTLNKLCTFLEVEPSDFFEFIPDEEPPKSVITYRDLQQDAKVLR
ncbi:Cro/Cl family transcriptional regulator [Bacillus cereus]|uniref:Cro/Cl family transcriptional regulator n=1 Tax=Bacillus cereus TaxID=1396 RepID=A0A9X7CQQ7_BACCE|nr:helix-turn-helix domain-containing protein [Bacillus cereus]PGS81662.1 Cro/Cl family transcriptional regulator [Bacillus cereus]